MLTVTDRRSDDKLLGDGPRIASALLLLAGFLRSDLLVRRLFQRTLWTGFSGSSPGGFRKLLLLSATRSASLSSLLSVPRNRNVDFSIIWRSDSRWSKASSAEMAWKTISKPSPPQRN